jgi:benzylsuccinate CoA-transferase BbsE subunit
MAESLLSGLRALDLTDQKGFICGKILGALGVEVIKVERPGGDPSRLIPPYIDNIPNPNKSLYWMAFNTDKKSITLNLEDKKGQAIFKKLVKKADFVIESFTPGYLESLGIGYKALSRLNPKIIMTSITSFGQTGPYAHYKGSELIASAMSGVLICTGDPDKPPVREGPDAIYYRANTIAAFATILSDYYRDISGQGQQVDVSLQEVDFSRTMINIISWEFDKSLHKRSGPGRTFGSQIVKNIWPCKDGYVMWFLSGAMFGANSNRALSQWLDEDGVENPFRHISNWEEFDMAKLTPETVNEWQTIIGEQFFSRHTKKEIAEGSLKRGIDALVVNDPADVLSYPHLRERKYWTEIAHPESGISLEYPKHFFLSSQTDNYVKCRAPLIGEGNDRIYNQELSMSPAEIQALKEAGII